MSDRPVLLYYGPDAVRAAEEFDARDQSFAVAGVDAGADPATVADSERLDCLLLHGEDYEEIAAVVAAVRERRDGVPVVVVQTGAVPTLEAATDLGATHHYVVEAGVDPVALLAQVAPVVSTAIERRRERSMFDSLLANIPMSVYFKDRESRHERVSDAMLDMVGPDYVENEEGKRHHAPDDVVGKTDFDLYTDELAAETVADDRAVVESGEPVVDRIEHSHGEQGTGTYVATSKAPWYDADGRVVGIVGITRDVSERKRYEYQLERQNERLERFATMVSHDIRNPLSVAVGRLDAARETGDPEHFDAIERALERIESLVVDVLAVTRQGESVLDPEPVALATVATDAWSGVETDGATLRTPTALRLLAEPGRLRELLANCFENAVQHGPGPDREAVTVTVGDLPSDAGFYVADDGVGVPPDRVDSLFDPGISEADTTGMGLSVVAAIADAHNWRVEVTESDGGGARFEFHGVRRPFDEE